MLQRPHDRLAYGDPELGRGRADPQLIHAFDSPGKLKGGGGAGAAPSAAWSDRRGCLPLLRRRVATSCLQLGPTAAVWVVGAL